MRKSLGAEPDAHCKDEVMMHNDELGQSLSVLWYCWAVQLLSSWNRAAGDGYSDILCNQISQCNTVRRSKASWETIGSAVTYLLYGIQSE
jgi:hypothetical protein